MHVLFTIVLPIFALVGAGWAARYFQFLGPTAAFELNRFVVYLGMPALLFQIMVNATWKDLDQPGFAAAFGLGCAVIYAVTVVVRVRKGMPLADASLDGLNAGYANVGFIGFPLCLAAFGPASLPLVTLSAILTVCILFAIAVLLVELGTRGDGSAASISIKVGFSLLKNPMLMAPLIGVLYGAFAPPLGEGPNRFLTLLASAASPCALVSLGAFIASSSVKLEWERLSTLIILKLVAQPALTWLLATYVFKLDSLLTAVAVVIAALPTGTGAYMLANMYGRNATTTAASVLVSTVLSVVTIAILVSKMTGP